MNRIYRIIFDPILSIL
ncbi:MAG: hypothetical protein KKG76_05575 [Euryarchaeota archaeon]|nr:hypothetical protein [Euryarchaeota archaeon]MBU4139711.1 hypothetical protein [Euryarchaeota archaeon]